MIQLTPQMRILLAVAPVDFRKGIDGLAAVCRQVLQADPFAGHVFVFRNRKATAIKVLIYDGQGFWLCQKRLSRGRFTWWPDNGARLHPMAVHELQILIWNGNPEKVNVPSPWRRIETYVLGDSVIS
jgi:transposase